MDASKIMSNASGVVTGAIWVFALAGLAFALFSAWTVEVAAAKEDEPRWMAWVPVANAYLLFRLAGFSLGAFMLVLFGSMALFGIAGVISTGIGSWFLLAVVGVWSLGIWLLTFLLCVRIAERRGVHPFVGVLCAAGPVINLLTVIPFLMPLALVPFVAWLYIVFHDGTPGEPPHPLAWAVTAVGLVAVAVPLTLFSENVGAWNELMAEQMESTTDMDMAALTAALEAETAPPAVAVPPSPPAAPEADPSDRVRELAAALAHDGRERESSEVLIEDDGACPKGTEVAGARFPDGHEIWCTRGTTRHGPYVAWYPSGELEARGHFRDGLESGLWVRYWENGVRKVEAEFQDGVQHGTMTQFDQMGFVQAESRWDQGQPISH